MIFMAANKSRVEICKQVPDEFKEFSGMAANVGKGEVYLSGVTEEAKQKILGVLHFKAKSNKSIWKFFLFQVDFLGRSANLCLIRSQVEFTLGVRNTFYLPVDSNCFDQCYSLWDSIGQVY